MKLDPATYDLMFQEMRFRADTRTLAAKYRLELLRQELETDREYYIEQQARD